MMSLRCAAKLNGTLAMCPDEKYVQATAIPAEPHSALQSAQLFSAHRFEFDIVLHPM